MDLSIYTADIEREMPRIREYLEEKIWKKECSRINIIYNHYENTTTIYSKKLQIFPIVRKKETDIKSYNEDFAMEGDINDLMNRMIATYVYYELKLALVNSRAAENIMRQNATTESLKKIDEMEEEAQMEERRTRRNKEFQKVVDNYVKKKMY
ncbi:MAG: F0F1 ATP synthase subunit gamma [Lachnospiraceae bacterium]